MTTYDVIVIGAGPAGCAAAYHASRAGYRTLVLDRSPFPRAKTCGDGLSPRSIEAIARMGLRDLPDSASRGVRIVTGRNVSIHDSTVLTGDGYKVVPRYLLDELLLDQAIAAGAVHWTAKATRITAGESSRQTLSEVRVSRGSSERRLRCRTVICAAGHRGARGLVPGYVSRTSTWAVAARTYVELRDDLLDLEVYMAGASPTGEALGYGWVFPSFAGRANVGVGVLRRPGLRAPNPARLVAEFIAALREQRPGLGFEQLQPIDVAPIPLELHAPVAHRGILVVGDSAGLPHPLTAEGISAALESGEAAARALLAADARAGQPNAGQPNAGQPNAGQSNANDGDASTTLRDHLAHANPMSFASAGRVEELHNCARLVAGRGLDALTHPTPTLGTSLRRILLRAKPRPTYLRADAREELDALSGKVRGDLVATVSKLNPFLAELLRDATTDPRGTFGRHLALALRVRRESSPRGALPERRISALAVMEALEVVVRLHDDLADSAAQGGWGNHALSMTLIDALNAYALRETYAQPRSICRLLSAAAEQALCYALHAAVETAGEQLRRRERVARGLASEAQRMRARLTLYRCSAALGTRDARHEQLPASAERLAKALATMSRAGRGREPHTVAEQGTKVSASAL